jgi:hypothetical protein
LLGRAIVFSRSDLFAHLTTNNQGKIKMTLEFILSQYLNLALKNCYKPCIDAINSNDRYATLDQITLIKRILDDQQSPLRSTGDYMIGKNKVSTFINEILSPLCEIECERSLGLADRRLACSKHVLEIMLSDLDRFGVKDPIPNSYDHTSIINDYMLDHFGLLF